MSINIYDYEQALSKDYKSSSARKSCEVLKKIIELEGFESEAKKLVKAYKSKDESKYKNAIATFKQFVDPYGENYSPRFLKVIEKFVLFGEIVEYDYAVSLDIEDLDGDFKRVSVVIEPEATQEDVISFVRTNWKKIKAAALPTNTSKAFQKRLRQTPNFSRDRDIVRLAKTKTARQIADVHPSLDDADQIRKIVRKHRPKTGT